MDINAKYRPFYIARLLEELTDENHYLTTAQISNLLEERYGMTTYRQTIASDMEILRTVGMDIQCVSSTQNRYWLRSRRFDDAELQTLVEAVKGCQAITEETREMLIDKLAREAGTFKEDSLKEGVVKKIHSRVSGSGGVTQKHLLELWAEMNLPERIRLIECAEAELKKDDTAPAVPAAEPENRNLRRKKKQLTGKQQVTYDFIREEVKKKGYPPTVREVCEYLGLSSASAGYARLKSLEKAGYIRRDPSKPRAIEIC